MIRVDNVYIIDSQHCCFVLLLFCNYIIDIRRTLLFCFICVETIVFKSILLCEGSLNVQAAFV